MNLLFSRMVFLAIAFFTISITAVAQSTILISEFRLRGPSGANDEFLEIYNQANTPHTVTPISGTGYGVAASDGVTRCTVPTGTIIPAYGHYLCTNSLAYSLSGYATGDATFTTDIPDNAGIAIFNNNTGGASYSLANRLDAVGSTSEANTLYKEGTGYPALTPFSIDYAFTRLMIGMTDATITGTSIPTMPVHRDTDDNLTDFYFVDTNGTSAGAGQRLGAPGPENFASALANPVGFTRAHLDPCNAPSTTPNKIRDLTSDPANNSTFGTVDFRRTFTNNTGGNITRLRFRLVKLTTFPAPTGFSDLRPRTSGPLVVNVDRAPCGAGTSNVTVEGTTLEQPPSQPNGGGWNSTMSANTVTLGTPLANGASIDVRFLFGIQQTGEYSFSFIVEALPRGGAVWSVHGHTESTFPDTEDGATAAESSISGQVRTADGRGISRAIVTVVDNLGASRTAITNAFGYYSFDGIQSGESYLISATSKSYRFNPLAITVNGDLTDVNLTAF